ncbi:MAG: HEPN domain-containing protein [Bacteroidia bacterium]|nr:HEPN domain-containing protein [Bacteroidia bacterium]
MKNNNEFNKWLNLAEQDLGTAKIIYLHISEYKETICFHCQQAVEKYFKAYLVFLKISFLYKHDLIYLLNLIAQKDKFPLEYYQMAAKLDSFAVQIRYPNLIIKPTDEEVKEAIEIAEKFRELIIPKLLIKNNE